MSQGHVPTGQVHFMILAFQYTYTRASQFIQVKYSSKRTISYFRKSTFGDKPLTFFVFQQLTSEKVVSNLQRL
jgi:hypothetical protein